MASGLLEIKRGWIRKHRNKTGLNFFYRKSADFAPSPRAKAYF